MFRFTKCPDQTGGACERGSLRGGMSGMGLDGAKPRQKARNEQDTGKPQGFSGLWRGSDLLVYTWPAGCGVDSFKAVNMGKRNGQGARIHKPTLWRMGCRSATAFRGWLGLAVYWDKYATGRHERIYATVPVDRTNPSGKHKRHPMANRLPPLDAYNVILLTASPNDARGASGQRMALKRGKDWLESLESKGKVIIERLGRMGGVPWRILEPHPGVQACGKAMVIR